ncbi:MULTISPECIES: ATP-binding protein [Paracoccus]|uniref:sensor histidine kinase n=1 Tax=Paracoccus TaxID=265 RepID=UPI0023F2127F|nr:MULTISPECIES: ATP-binding protein [Paracoccus]
MRDITIVARGLDSACPVVADERMLEIALRNILDNAVKYSDADGRITLDLARQGREAVLTLADEGRGFQGDPSRLLDRFHRGANVGDVAGSGLGLTIVAEVAAAHRGRFRLTPRDTGGTCAVLSLPLA